MKTAWFGWISVCALFISACGGGGSGSSSNSNATNDPTLVVSSSTVSVSYPVTTATASAIVNFEIRNLPSNEAYIAVSSSNAGIESVAWQQTGVTTGVINIAFKAPYKTAPGTLTDTIQIQACLDSVCARPVSKSPLIVSVSYQVLAVSGANAPVIIPSGTPIDFHVLVTDPLASKTHRVVLNFANIPVAPRYLVHNTENAIRIVSYSSLQNNSVALDILFKDPTWSGVGLGNFSDTLTVTACLDPDCINPMANSPLTIPVSYTVEASVAGSYSIRALSVGANDIVWDSSHSRIYASVKGTAVSNANSFVTIDPVVGQVTSGVAAGSDPNRLAISDDNQYVYVGFKGASLLKRFNVASAAFDQTIALGADANFGPMFAHLIEVAPGNPTRIAVARGALGESAGGLALYENGSLLAQTIGGQANTPFFYSAKWDAAGAKLYALADQGLQTLSASLSGLAVQDTMANSSYQRIHYLSGLLYTTAGPVVDPVAKTAVGTFPTATFGNSAMVPDAALSRAFFLTSDFGGLELRSYNLLSFAQLGKINIASLKEMYGTPLNLIRWGNNGLAYSTDAGYVVLINGNFVGQ